jgi:hypothetical protein
LNVQSYNNVKSNEGLYRTHEPEYTKGEKKGKTKTEEEQDESTPGLQMTIRDSREESTSGEKIISNHTLK